MGDGHAIMPSSRCADVGGAWRHAESAKTVARFSTTPLTARDVGRFVGLPVCSPTADMVGSRGVRRQSGGEKLRFTLPQTSAPRNCRAGW